MGVGNSNIDTRKYRSTFDIGKNRGLYYIIDACNCNHTWNG